MQTESIHSESADARNEQPGSPDLVEPARGADDSARLFARVRVGDRAAAAEFMVRYGPILRQRFRARLGKGLRRLLDSGDLISTVSRRFDRAVALGKVAIGGQGELISYLHGIAEHVIADRARVYQRLRVAEAPDGPIAASLLKRMNAEGAGASPASAAQGEAWGRGFDDTIEFVFGALNDPEQERMLALWLSGMNHAEIAEEMGINHAAARARWGTLRKRIAEVLEAADVR